MPTFDSSIDIDVSEFLSELTHKEIDELIDELITDGHIKKECKRDSKFDMLSPEYELQEKIYNGFWKLSSEDQDTITKILDKIVL